MNYSFALEQRVDQTLSYRLPSEWLARPFIRLADLSLIENPQTPLHILKNMASKTALFVGSLLGILVASVEVIFLSLLHITFSILNESLPSSLKAQETRAIAAMGFFADSLAFGQDLLVIPPSKVHEHHIKLLLRESIQEISKEPLLYSLFDDNGDGWKDKLKRIDPAIILPLCNYVAYKELLEPLRIEDYTRETLQKKVDDLFQEERMELAQKILGRQEGKKENVHHLFKGITKLGDELHRGKLKKPFFEALAKECAKV